RDRCHPAHTSETHRHPEEEVRMNDEDRSDYCNDCEPYALAGPAAGFRLPDLRPQTSDLRPQTSDLRPQTSDLRP
ncbi:MAG TPA: hypothetical protein VN345_17440, partial [Blastocatellia bacterium]|nr:hypothetical protein [Blastocatellia bacterium]